MHYYALVEIPPGAEDIDAAVGAAMEPHRETDDGSGIWDWWSIGGRWTGHLSDYEPRTDRRNMKVCWLCHGTGRRDDEAADAWRAEHPDYDYGCNGCESTGIQVKFASHWVRHEGDVTYRGLLDDSQAPFTLITGGRAFSKEHWDGDNFIDTTGELEAAWSSLDPGTRLVVVDYHC
jgi:hypothetical protein